MTEVVETALHRLYSAADGPAAGVALAAVGSLARRELGPRSDVDLVLLHDGSRPELINQLAEKLWYPLWDDGIRLDHSVRTPAECAAVAVQELPAGVGLLDLRVIAGDQAMTAAARTELLTSWRNRVRQRLEELIASVDERSATFGDAAYLLEPDLKEAHGGFRDMIMLRALAATWLTDRPHDGVRERYQFLLDVRDALHVSSGRALDRLLAGEAEEVAQRLGFDSIDALHREVSLAARTIGHALDLTVRTARQVVPARRTISFARRQRRPEIERAPHGLIVHLGEVGLDRGALPSDPVIGLRAGALAAQRGLVLSPITVERLGDFAPDLPDPWPPEALQAMLDMLSAGPALPPVWEALELNGCISRWITDWELIRALPQYNPIHRYTVDRHSMQTAVEAHRHLTTVDRPDLLLLACLLHDIGKGLRAQGVPPTQHATAGAPLARRIVVEMGVSAADADVIELLVREHLTLSTLATRRDHGDPATIDALIAAVNGKAENLIMLRALTEADARAAGTQAWSPWRAQLINNLADRVVSKLEGNPVPDDVRSELAIGLARSVRLDRRPRISLEHQSGGVELVIACEDRLGLFSDTAGLLSAHHVPVRSALISTVDGVAVNTWRVQATSAADLPDPAYLVGELQRLADHDQRILARVRRRESRGRHHDQPPNVQYIGMASRTAAVIEVRAPDRSGLLYALGTALAAASLAIRSAHVTTLAGQAIDTFYITEVDDSRPNEDRCHEAVKILTESAAGQIRTD